jgi:hypothetical protein
MGALSPGTAHEGMETCSFQALPHDKDALTTHSTSCVDVAQHVTTLGPLHPHMAGAVEMARHVAEPCKRITAEGTRDALRHCKTSPRKKKQGAATAHEAGLSHHTPVEALLNWTKTHLDACLATAEIILKQNVDPGQLQWSLFHVTRVVEWLLVEQAGAHHTTVCEMTSVTILFSPLARCISFCRTSHATFVVVAFQDI